MSITAGRVNLKTVLLKYFVSMAKECPSYRPCNSKIYRNTFGAQFKPSISLDFLVFHNPKEGYRDPCLSLDGGFEKRSFKL